MLEFPIVKNLVNSGAINIVKNLVIVESPAKAKTISKFLGSDYTVMASMGHVRDLPKSKLGFEIEYSMVDYATQKMMADGITADPAADVGGIDMLGKVTNFETADNIKVLFSYTYSF
jgi:hypothetical protein